MISLTFKTRIDLTHNVHTLKEEAAIMHRIADQLSPMSPDFIEYTERIQYVYERMRTIVRHPTKKRLGQKDVRRSEKRTIHQHA